MFTSVESAIYYRSLGQHAKAALLQPAAQKMNAAANAHGLNSPAYRDAKREYEALLKALKMG